jgi:hypothetical protein
MAESALELRAGAWLSILRQCLERIDRSWLIYSRRRISWFKVPNGTWIELEAGSLSFRGRAGQTSAGMVTVACAQGWVQCEDSQTV